MVYLDSVKTMFEEDYFSAPHLSIVESGFHSPYELRLYSDGILYIRVRETEPETPGKLSKLVELIGKITKGQKVPILVMHDEFAIPGKENRELWARKETCPYSIAEVFIVKTFAMQLVSNFYLSFNKPGRPTKMFSNIKDAQAWLHSMKKAHNQTILN